MSELQSFVLLVLSSVLLGRSLTIFFKRDFSFHDHSSLVLYDGLALVTASILGLAPLSYNIGELFALAALLYSIYRYKNDELVKTLTLSISIYIVMGVDWRQVTFDCVTLVLATTQYLRRPDRLKEALREMRIILGPVYVISVCSGIRFLSWKMHSLIRVLSVLSSVVAAVFFRPDNNETLKLMFSKSGIPTTDVRRRVHGYLMFSSYVVTIAMVLYNSTMLLPGVARCALFFGVVNITLYLTYKASRRWN